MAKEIPSNNAVNLLCEGTMIVGDIKTKNDTPVVLLLYTSPSPRDRQKSRMPSSA